MLGAKVRAAQHEAASLPIAGADPKPRWTLKRLVGLVHARFGRLCCRGTIRAALYRLGLSWKKAKKLLGRADPARRRTFVKQLRPLLDGAQRGKRFFVASSPPGLSAKVSFYGLYLYNEGRVSRCS